MSASEDPAIRFDVNRLGQVLKARLPEALFAILHGSAAKGVVRPDGDIDLALYLRDAASDDLYARVHHAVEEVAPGAAVDLGMLNTAGPVFRFEALRGRLLFTRDEEAFDAFFSITCREYEAQMADYARQLRYRREAAGVG